MNLLMSGPNYGRVDYEIINKYDQEGNLVVHTTSKGEYKEYRYDERSNLIYYNSNYGVEEVIKEYDKKDRVISIKTSSGTLTEITYIEDKEGRLIRKVSIITDLDTDINHTISENYEYFEDGSYSITYYSDLKEYKIETYDAKGNLTLEDSKKFTRIFIYNDDGKRIKEANSLGIEEYWTYASNGNMIFHTVTRNGKEKLRIEYEYDKNGNMVLEHNSNGAFIRYQYDDKNNCIEKSSNVPTNNISFKYDKMNRKIMSVSGQITEFFEYDDDGHLIKFTRFVK